MRLASRIWTASPSQRAFASAYSGISKKVSGNKSALNGGNARPGEMFIADILFKIILGAIAASPLATFPIN